MPAFQDLSGRQFGSLTVIERAENGKDGATRWLCECKCKNKKVVMAKHLKSGAVDNCGCLRAKRMKETKIGNGSMHGGKAVGDGMKTFLTNLSSDDDIQAIERIESVSNALADSIVAAVTMVAWARRISDDLYEGAGSFRTPLEEYAAQKDEDGFSEPEKEEE